MSGKRKSSEASHDAAARFERACLSCLVECPELLAQANLSSAHFHTSTHQQIFQAMLDLGSSLDIVSLADRTDGRVDAAYISGLLDSGAVAVPATFHTYCRKVREFSDGRRFRALTEQLGEATNGDRLALVEKILDLLTRGSEQNWRSVFHSLADFENSPDLSFAIENFLQESAITIVAGLAGHSKTLVMLSMTKALLTGESLFNCDLFRVPKRSARVLYLVPESAAGPFWSRIKLFRLQDFVRADQLLIRTLSCPEQITLEDPRLLRAADGADIFLDTAIRFMDGSENDAESSREFASVLFRLLSEGARTITGAHHSPKSFESVDCPSLETSLRGSSDIGAMIASCWALRQINDSDNSVFISNCKARDFSPAGDFVIQGRPWIDQNGDFRMLEQPGQAASLRHYLDQQREADKGGRPALANKAQKMHQAAEMRAQGKSLREIAQAMGISKDTVNRMLFDFDSNKEPVQ